VYRRRSRCRPPVPEKEANGDSGSDQDALKDSLDTFVVAPKTSWAGQASEGPGGGPNSSTQLPLGAAAAEQGSINGGSSFSSGSRDAAPAGNPTTGYAAAAAVTAAVAGAAVGTNPSPAPAGELASLPPLAEDLADGPMATFPTRPAGGPPMSLASLQADGAAAAGPSMVSMGNSWHHALAHALCADLPACGHMAIHSITLRFAGDAGGWRREPFRWPACLGSRRHHCRQPAAPVQRRCHACHVADRFV